MGTKLRFTLSESGRVHLDRLEMLLDWLEPHLDGRVFPARLDNAVLLLLLAGMCRRVRAMCAEVRGGSA